MTRRLDFNIFSLGAIALIMTVIISLFAGISSNSLPPSDPPYSLNLEKSPSGSYLNLLVAESDEKTSLKIRTDHYSSTKTAPKPTSEPPESSTEAPSIASTTTTQPSSDKNTVNDQNTKTAENNTKNPTDGIPSTTNTPKPTNEPTINNTDLTSLITEFSARNKKISALLDQLDDSLSRLYLEKIIYQPELDSLYSLLSELDQLLTLESDFVSTHSSELPDFYHRRHNSNLPSFSNLRDRLNYLLENLKPLSEDINTYSYATFCESLAHSTSKTSTETPDIDSPTPTESHDTPTESEPSQGESISDESTDETDSINSEPNSPTKPESNIQDTSTSDTPEPTSADSSDPENAESTTTLDSFGFPICSDASYVAEKAFELYSISLSDWGNTSSWRDSALSLGLTVDDSPSAHSIGLSRSGSSPHAIWVESLSSSPITTPTPSSDLSTSSDLTLSSPLINLSEYDSILSPLNFTYRTNTSASPYLFIHLDSYAPNSTEVPSDNPSEENTTDATPSDTSTSPDDTLLTSPDPDLTTPTDN